MTKYAEKRGRKTQRGFKEVSSRRTLIWIVHKMMGSKIGVYQWKSYRK
jgi:hypothetical protein